jgi:hypothetical protein
MVSLMRNTLALTALTISALAGGGVHAANILVNPGFESGALDPWFQSNSFSAGVDWAVTSADSHSGTYSAIDTGNKELQQNFAPVLGSLITDVSFWEKHPDGDFPSYVEVLYQDGTSSHTLVTTSDAGWDFFNVTSLVVPTEKVTGLGIYGYCCSSSSQTLLDDLDVSVNVPEPATWTLMLVGFVGMGAAALRSHRKAMAAA